jgi:hypothetical protein
MPKANRGGWKSTRSERAALQPDVALDRTVNCVR